MHLNYVQIQIKYIFMNLTLNNYKTRGFLLFSKFGYDYNEIINENVLVY